MNIARESCINLARYYATERDKAHTFIMDGFMINNHVGRSFGLSDTYNKLRAIFVHNADMALFWYRQACCLYIQLIPEIAESLDNDDYCSYEGYDDYPDDMGIGVMDFF